MQKTVSPQKREANRRNAQKSTGPKTLEGKNKVSKNAFKHGLRSSTVVIRNGDAKESQADYDLLLSQLIEDLKPVAILEHMQVKEIADCLWRKERAKRCEVGEIGRGLDDPLSRFGLEPGSDFRQIEEWIGNFESISDDFKRNGFFSEKSAALLNAMPRNRVAQMLIPSIERFQPGDGSANGQPPEQGMEPLKQTTARLLKAALKFLARQAERSRKEEARVVSNQIAAFSLPANGVLDRILRYETTYNRQLERAMDRLERLQRRRQEADA